jgi:hypothetical protein
MSLRGRGGLTRRMTTTVVLRAPICRGDIPALCDGARERMRHDPAGPVIFDVSGLEQPDAVAVEALARLQLTALRLGRRITVRCRGGDLEGLLALVGLVDLLPVIEVSPLEALRQAEEREQMRRVEEEGDGGDATV